MILYFLNHLNNRLAPIQKHLLCCNYSPSFKDFSILILESNDFKLKIMESLLMAHGKPALNKSNSWMSLELFWWNCSGYYIFYQILWYSSIPLSLYNCGSSVFNSIYNFICNKLWWAFTIVLDISMETVAFES